jgi:hypothetical protein
MTLRDYFAAQAMQGIIASISRSFNELSRSEVASDAYSMADAMLAAREEA